MLASLELTLENLWIPITSMSFIHLVEIWTEGNFWCLIFTWHFHNYYILCLSLINFRFKLFHLQRDDFFLFTTNFEIRKNGGRKFFITYYLLWVWTVRNTFTNIHFQFAGYYKSRDVRLTAMKIENWIFFLSFLPFRDILSYE